ncbi:purine-nucleoside phosphorylase [Nocardiopsis composta]|uniref:Purine nucleoside phosphorylase n=1 Tax=Nocardiopsis composta TaxID=157465 RepID=A0A7W8VE50_9ACTN|nr:purine-nucleoside phosphorylase [Nocardiopsis composta]MBB5432942.1 purine-nucleoside phosphorylase [Nocardiopsis composta]
MATTTAAAKERASAAAEELTARTGADSFDAAVVLGSGWGVLADRLGTADTEVDAGELPGFTAPSTPEHSSQVRSVWVGSKRVALFGGRVHLFETRDPLRAVHAVRTAIAAGARTVVLTGSAGSLRTDFAVGQPILVRDHVNLTGASPLVGPDFVDLTRAYSARLRGLAREVDPSLAEGVYAEIAGPQLATPAELAMIRAAGADLVGHSLALEAIAAVEMGAEVLAVSAVSNDAVASVVEPFDREQATEAARHAADRTAPLLHEVLMRA